MLIFELENRSFVSLFCLASHSGPESEQVLTIRPSKGSIRSIIAAVTRFGPKKLVFHMLVLIAEGPQGPIPALFTSA